MENNSKKSAFPLPENRDSSHPFGNGLTKREYFAAKAMEGMVGGFMKNKVSLDDIEEPVRICAQWSIKFADELLKQLEEKRDLRTLK